MLPASRAAMVPVFMATPTSAWASAGASLVPSPHIATSLPLACSSRISSSLASGVAWARKSSTPASAAMAAAVSGLSPVIMTVRMPIRRSSAKRSRMPPLTMSLRWMTPSSRPSSATASGVPPDLAMLVGDRARARGAACGRRGLAHRRAPHRPRPCGSTAPSTSTPLMRVWAENGHELGVQRRHLAAADAVLLLGQHDDRAAFRRLVGEARRAAPHRPARARSTPRHRHELGRLAVAERDRAGLVEQQRVDVARRLDGAARHGEHVEAHQPVHAGDADGRQQRADRGRDQGDEQRDQHEHRASAPPA